MILPLKIAQWPAEWKELYEERAAIMEIEGKMPRRLAEVRAADDVRKLALSEKESDARL